MLGHGVITAFAERMAPGYTLYAQPGTLYDTVPGNSFVGVLGACRDETA